jgi:hypothetical protein
MKKLQLAAILSAALFGADCSGMTPQAERIIRERYNQAWIPIGDNGCLNTISVLMAASDKSPDLAESSREVGLAVNRLAKALSAKGVKKDSPELLAAQTNLVDAHGTYINQMLGLPIVVPQRPAARQVALAPVPTAQQRQEDEQRQRLIEEQNRRDDLMLQNLQPLPLSQQTGGLWSWFTNLFG